MAGFTKKQWLITAIILLLVGSATWLVGNLKANYATAAQDYKKQLSSAYDAQKQAFADLPATATNQDAAGLMQQSELRLTDILNHTPQPSFIITATGPGPAYGRTDKLKSAGWKLVQALRDTRRHVAYETALRPSLQTISSTPHTSPSELQAFTKILDGELATMRKLVVPEASATTHAKLIAAYETIGNTADGQLKAIESNDFRAYLAAADTLDQNIDSLLSIGPEFTKLAKGYDQGITAAFNELGDLLGKP